MKNSHPLVDFSLLQHFGIATQYSTLCIQYLIEIISNPNDYTDTVAYDILLGKQCL